MFDIPKPKTPAKDTAVYFNRSPFFAFQPKAAAA